MSIEMLVAGSITLDSLHDVWATRPIASPTTICHPVYQMGRGGLEQQLLRVLGQLNDDRFRHVLVVRGANPLACLDVDELGKNICVIVDASEGPDRRWSRRLAAILREEKVDALHVRGLTMLRDAVAAAGKAGIPAAFSFHGFERRGRQFGGIRRRLIRSALGRCDARWAVSRAAATAVAEELGVEPESFEILPNGVDTATYRSTLRRFTIRRQFDLPPDRLILACVGNLKPVKGHAILLQALRSLAPLAGRITVVLVGRDYLEGRLQAQAARDLAEFDIRFVGERETALPWLQAADLFVLPSLFEGSSNALLEAMSVGLPVIATAIGGTTEVVEHGKTGLLTPPGDAVELASAVRYLVEDAECRDRLGGAARRSIESRYALQDTATLYAKQYLRLAGRGAGMIGNIRATGQEVQRGEGRA